MGNESEADAYAENNFEKGSYTDRKDIAKKIAALPYKGIGKSRIVVITQGCDPCILAGNGEVSEIPVIKLARGNSVNEAIRCGVWAATEIIQVSGCTCDPAK